MGSSLTGSLVLSRILFSFNFLLASNLSGTEGRVLNLSNGFLSVFEPMATFVFKVDSLFLFLTHVDGSEASLISGNVFGRSIVLNRFLLNAELVIFCPDGTGTGLDLGEDRRDLLGFSNLFLRALT